MLHKKKKWMDSVVGGYLPEDFATLEVVILYDDDAFDGVDVIQMVDVVALTQVDGHLTVGRGFFKNFHWSNHGRCGGCVSVLTDARLCHTTGFCSGKLRLISLRLASMTMDGSLIEAAQGPIRFPDTVRGLLLGSTLNLFDSDSSYDDNLLAYVFLLLFAENVAMGLLQ